MDWPQRNGRLLGYKTKIDFRKENVSFNLRSRVKVRVGSYCADRANDTPTFTFFNVIVGFHPFAT